MKYRPLFFLPLYDVVVTHSELPARTLSEILAPSSLMVGRKFELNVDEWKFVGHPFSAQTVSFTTACNVIFILQVNVFEMYTVCCCRYTSQLCSLAMHHKNLKVTLLKCCLLLCTILLFCPVLLFPGSGCGLWPSVSFDWISNRSWRTKVSSR